MRYNLFWNGTSYVTGGCSSHISYLYNLSIHKKEAYRFSLKQVRYKIILHRFATHNPMNYYEIRNV